MHTRKISLNNFIIPRNKNVLNEQILFKDKLQLPTKISKLNGQNNIIENKNELIKIINNQQNCINEEDHYIFEVYNNSIEKDENFLIEYENNNKFKTIPLNNNFNGINTKFNTFNNIQKLNQNYGTNSIEFNNNLSLNNIEGNDNNIDDNINYLMNNINLFKMVHKERKQNKLLNNILSKEDNNISSTNMKNEKYVVTNKFSKKYRFTNNNKKNDNGIISNHTKVISEPLNGPYLRKNKFNQIKNINKNNEDNNNNNFEYVFDLNDDESNSNNITKIKAITKSLFNRYSQRDISLHNLKRDKINEKEKDINKKNKKIKIITSSLYDSKRNDSLEKNNLKDQNKNSYIFNLKFYNIYNNKDNNNLKIKSKSNSMINEYYSFDDNNINKSINKKKKEKEEKEEKDENPKQNIIKKRVIFEEEYILDANGNQKFLCVKRVANDDDDNINTQDNINNNKEFNKSKRAYTSNNIFNSSNYKNYKKNIEDYNPKNNNKKYINGNSNQKKNNNRKIEAKTVFFSPQISYENIFSPNNNNITKPNEKILENSKKQYILYNTNKLKDINNIPNSKSCIFKFDQNIKFHKIDNYSNKNSFNSKNRVPSYKSKKTEEKNIINSTNKINYETKKKLKNQNEGEKAITINNSRNYNTNNLININDYNNINKEKYILNSINDKINNKKNLYKTANFEINKISIPQKIFYNKSENNNFKFHEIKSTSKDKYCNNKINNSNKNHNNYCYFELKNKRQKISPCTSMDNIKIQKNNSKYNNSYKFLIKDRLEKYNKGITMQNLNIDNPNYPLYYSQELNVN